MVERLKLKYEEHLVWIYPGIHMLLGLVLSYLVVRVDLSPKPLTEFVPRILLTSVSLARTILGSLATSLLTITTFTFSTIMAVLTMYASNYSPRIVENFLKEKISLRVLGIFLGGFVYSITSLLFMRDTLESDLVISATIGIIYAIVCCVYFVRFISKVATSTQAAKLISRLSELATKAIESEQEEKREGLETEEEPYMVYDHNRPVYSDKTGYVQFIDLDHIYDKIKEKPVQVVLMVDEGKFVTQGDLIARVAQEKEVAFSFKTKDQEEEEVKIDDILNGSIAVQSFRNDSYDFRFSIQKIEEIAVRALSPGINDPYTAVEAVNALGYVMQKMAKRDTGYYFLKEDDLPAVLYYRANSFQSDLIDVFHPIIHYGCQDVFVLKGLFNAYKNIAFMASESNLKAIKELAKYTYERGRATMDHPFDQGLMEEDYQKLCAYMARCGH